MLGLILCNAHAFTVGDKPPEWIELIPAGKIIKGLDGRSWPAPDRGALVAEFNRTKRPIVLDWAHGTHIKEPRGEKADAAAWIDELKLRDDGVIVGHIEKWLPTGAADVAEGKVRFVSPAFLPDGRGGIAGLASAGLTNNPNLTLAALNAAFAGDNMIDPRIIKALGLPDSATIEDVLAAIQKLSADLNTRRVELTNLVPRGDYDVMLNRATTAETALKQRDAADFAAKVEIELNAAQADSVITPGTREYHKSAITTQAQLDEFTKYRKAAPKLVQPTDLNTRQTPGAGGGAADPESAKIFKNLGLDEKGEKLVR